MLISTSYKTKSTVSLEASLVYLLANHPPALCVPGGAPNKCIKSKLYDAALKYFYLTDGKQLPGKETLHTYYLDVIALMQVLLQNNGTVRGIAWRILKIIPQQYSTIFIAFDSHNDNSIKNVESIGLRTGLKYLLKSPDMIIPSDFSMFMKNEDNKTTLLNLIEQVCVEENTKFHKDRVIYFSNETNCRKISTDGAEYCDTFFSDHEEQTPNW